jgi:hypothetical protein
MNKKGWLNYKKSISKSVETIKSSLSIMFSILLLVSLIDLFGKDYYSKIFSGNLITDSIIGALAGSVSFGIPVTSYIVGGELLKEGVSLIAITAFIMAWSTVGVAMLPLESKYLGRRFSIVRNLTNFVFSIIIAITTIATLRFFQ